MEYNFYCVHHEMCVQCTHYMSCTLKMDLYCQRKNKNPANAGFSLSVSLSLIFICQWYNCNETYTNTYHHHHHHRYHRQGKIWLLLLLQYRHSTNFVVVFSTYRVHNDILQRTITKMNEKKREHIHWSCV